MEGDRGGKMEDVRQRMGSEEAGGRAKNCSKGKETSDRHQEKKPKAKTYYDDEAQNEVIKKINQALERKKIIRADKEDMRADREGEGGSSGELEEDEEDEGGSLSTGISSSISF
jgi:hypothetical protein